MQKVFEQYIQQAPPNPMLLITGIKFMDKSVIGVCYCDSVCVGVYATTISSPKAFIN